MASRLKKGLIEEIDSCQTYQNQIRQCQMEMNTRAKALKSEIDSVTADEIKPIKEQEKINAAQINLEFDMKNEPHFEEIRKNNEERERRLENNKSDSEYKQAPIICKRRELFRDIQQITETIELEIGRLEKSFQDGIAIRENAKRALSAPSTKDHGHGNHGFNQSVTDALRIPLDFDRLKRLTRTVSGLRFVKGVGREKINGRIDGYHGDCRLVKKVNISHANAELTFELPIIVGCTDATRVLITDRGGYMNTYLLDLTTKRAMIVILGSDKSYVISCASFGDGRTVCGKRRIGYTSQNQGKRLLTGCISVYDGHWKLMNDLAIPRNTSRDDTWVDVAVDPVDGNVIAAEWGQSKIYVLHPENGSIFHTITCKHNINIALSGVQSTGHIIATSSADTKLFKIDRRGAHQREIPCKDLQNVCIDPLTDALYAVTSDSDYKKCVIDQVAWRGGHESTERRVVSIDLSSKPMQAGRFERLSHLVLSKIIMTPSGKIIACNGSEIICITKDIQSLR